MKNIKSIRREYGNSHLSEKNISVDPFAQFENWLSEALDNNILDATSMVLATADKNGIPDARVVLLKEFDHRGFVFFTHYDSPKATQAETSGMVALNFHWPLFSRQVRIKGKIARISQAESEAYFLSRPRESQISTLASQQSSIISSREEFERRIQKLTEEYQGKKFIVRRIGVDTA